MSVILTSRDRTLPRCPNPIGLDISCCSLKDPTLSENDAQALLSACTSCSTLVSLDISKNGFTETEIEHLVDHIDSRGQLRMLCQVPVQALAQDALTELTLSGPSSFESAIILRRYLPIAPSVSSITLGAAWFPCRRGRVDDLRLMAAMTSFKSGCGVGADAGTFVLALFLPRMSQLTCLDISENPPPQSQPRNLNSYGLDALCSAVLEHPVLKDFDISNNKLGNALQDSLLSSLHIGVGKLDRLNVGGNCLSSLQMTTAAVAIQQIGSITSLNKVRL